MYVLLCTLNASCRFLIMIFEIHIESRKNMQNNIYYMYALLNSKEMCDT